MWIKNGRSSILTEEFEEGNGFDLYIDGARFLPDSVTVSKVSKWLDSLKCVDQFETSVIPRAFKLLKFGFVQIFRSKCSYLKCSNALFEDNFLASIYRCSGHPLPPSLPGTGSDWLARNNTSNIELWKASWCGVMAIVWTCEFPILVILVMFQENARHFLWWSPCSFTVI